MFRIVTDTSANLPTAYLQQEHITIIPFTFHADGDEQACLDLNTFDAKTFYAQMRSGTKVSTSQIPPQRYLDVLTPMLEAEEDVAQALSEICRANHMTMEELQPYYDDAFAAAVEYSILLAKVTKLIRTSAVLED